MDDVAVAVLQAELQSAFDRGFEKGRRSKMTSQPSMPEDRLTPNQHRDLRKAIEQTGAEQQNAAPHANREITFEHSKENRGWPEPLILDLGDLSDRELASYIAASGFEYDGMGPTLREAVVRLLRR